MLNKNFIKKIKEKLVEEKNELIAKAKNQMDSDIESIDLDGDETDEIQGAILINIQNKIVTRHLEKISKINEALKRIDDSKYGFCEDCEDNIPEKRLTSNPYFVLCVSCAEDREIENKQKRM
jgi:DnaK suppressor protein